VLAYLRSLDPQLPRPVLLLQVGGFLNAFGNGLAFPFLVIYLHNVRGLELGYAGLAVALSSFTALLAGPLAGTLVDRVGGRAVLAGSLGLLALGYGGLPFVRETWHAFALAAVFGAGTGGFWPSQSSLTAGLTPRDRVHAAFSMQRVMNNAGIGLGAVAGGLIATTDDPSSFTVLFLLDAATFVAFAAVLLRIPPVRTEHEEEPGSYRQVLAHRVFFTALALNAAFVGAGYGMVELIGVFAKNDAGVSERGIGLVFLANTSFIVAAQLPVVRVLEGRRRMPAFALMGGLWAAAWLLALATGLWLETAAATALLALAAIVFGLGECVHGVVWGALVSDLAPRRLIGRYMALSSVSWQVGLTAGPAVGGFLLARSPSLFWLAAAAACLAFSAAALAFEPRLPREARRTPARVVEPARGIAARPSG
jgi:MFS family permease